MGNALIKLFTLVYILAIYWSCSKVNRAIYVNTDKPISMADTIYFKAKPGDQSAEFELLLNRSKDIIIVLDQEATYLLSDIHVNNNKNIQIIGNNSIIYPYKEESKAPIITCIDPKVFKIVNCTISGGHPNKKIENYLVKLHTPNDKTSLIDISDVNFIDGDGGGLMIQNIYNKFEGWEAGADTVIVSSCTFLNYGNHAACAIRGSHKAVFMDSCFASDPYGRQTGSHVFDFTAEVDINQDCLGFVSVKNVKTEYVRLEGLFFQKIKNLQVDGFYARYTGQDIKGNSYINNAIKVDDLGYGNKAIIKNVMVEESGDKAFASVAIEESPGQGHTSGVRLDSLDVDRLVRLGASGNHKVSNSTINNSELQFLSSNNVAQNIQFTNSTLKKSVYFAQFQDNKIYNSNFFNSLIEIGPEAKQVLIENCTLITNLKATYFIAIVLNNPSKPNIITIKNCTVPPNIYGVWSGGVQNASKNIELLISNKNRNQFLIHEHLIKESKLKYD